MTHAEGFKQSAAGDLFCLKIQDNTLWIKDLLNWLMPIIMFVVRKLNILLYRFAGQWSWRSLVSRENRLCVRWWWSIVLERGFDGATCHWENICMHRHKEKVNYGVLSVSAPTMMISMHYQWWFCSCMSLNMKENTRFLRDMITIALLSSQIHDICDAPMV